MPVCSGLLYKDERRKIVLENIPLTKLSIILLNM